MDVTIRNEKGETVQKWFGVKDVQLVPGPIPVLIMVSPLDRVLGAQTLGAGYSAEYGSLQ